MSEKILIIGALLLALSFCAEAQQPRKVPRVGLLVPGSPPAFSERVEAFRRGLRELGYVEEKNISVDYKYAEGRRDQLAHLATELVRRKVAVMVAAGGDGPARAAKNATATIPIVMTNVADPVRTDLVASLARPGGNVTGLASVTNDLSGKRLELLKEALPKIPRVAVLYDPDDPTKVIEFNDTQVTGASLGIQLQSLEVRRLSDFNDVFQAAKRGRTGTLLVLPTILTNTHRQTIVDLAAANRLPAMYPDSEFVNAGGLMGYGPSYPELFRRAAMFVDKILKGSNPAELPVEQPTKFELVINLKTANQIGLTISANVLARADRVIR
jgi:putative ABC transport system substrate-binding protein